MIVPFPDRLRALVRRFLLSSSSSSGGSSSSSSSSSSAAESSSGSGEPWEPLGEGGGSGPRSGRVASLMVILVVAESLVSSVRSVASRVSASS